MKGLLLFCGILFTHAALSDEKTPKVKPPATPEEAVKSFEAACKAKDFEKAVDLIAQPYHDPVLALGLISDARDVVRSACDAKFGMETGLGVALMHTKLELMNIHKIHIREKKEAGKDRFRLRVWEDTREGLRELEYFAVEEGGGWKLLRPNHLFEMGGTTETEQVTAPDGKERTLRKISYAKKPEEMNSVVIEIVLEMVEVKTKDEAIAAARKLREKAGIIAAAVKAEKYATRAEAIQAFNNAAPKKFHLPIRSTKGRKP